MKKLIGILLVSVVLVMSVLIGAGHPQGTISGCWNSYDVSSDSVHQKFSTWMGRSGQWSALYVGNFPNNSGNITFRCYSGGKLIINMTLPPAGTFSERVFFDSVAVTKVVAIDTISVNACIK